MSGGCPGCSGCSLDYFTQLGVDALANIGIGFASAELSAIAFTGTGLLTAETGPGALVFGTAAATYTYIETSSSLTNLYNNERYDGLDNRTFQEYAVDSLTPVVTAARPFVEAHITAANTIVNSATSYMEPVTDSIYNFGRQASDSMRNTYNEYFH